MVVIKHLSNCGARLSNLVVLACFNHVANKTSDLMIVTLEFQCTNDFRNAVVGCLSAALDLCNRMVSLCDTLSVNEVIVRKFSSGAL